MSRKELLTCPHCHYQMGSKTRGQNGALQIQCLSCNKVFALQAGRELAKAANPLVRPNDGKVKPIKRRGCIGGFVSFVVKLLIAAAIIFVIGLVIWSQLA